VVTVADADAAAEAKFVIDFNVFGSVSIYAFANDFYRAGGNAATTAVAVCVYFGDEVAGVYWALMTEALRDDHGFAAAGAAVAEKADVVTDVFAELGKVLPPCGVQ